MADFNKDDDEQFDFDEIEAMLDTGTESESVAQDDASSCNLTTDDTELETPQESSCNDAMDMTQEDQSEDEDFQDDDLDELLALAEADTDSGLKEQQPDVTQQKDSSPETVGSLEENNKIEVESSVGEASCSSTEAPTTSESVDSKDSILEEMKRMQQRMLELEQKLMQKDSIPSAPAIKEEKESSVQVAAKGAPTRTWSKTLVKPTSSSGVIINSPGKRKKISPQLTNKDNKKPRKLQEFDINKLLDEECASKSKVKKEVKQKAPVNKETAEEASTFAAALFGEDSDSDWEGLDGETPSNLSKQGREIKKIMVKKSKPESSPAPPPSSITKQKRVAHASNTSPVIKPAEARSFYDKSKPSTSFVPNNDQRPNKPKNKPFQEHDVFAPFTEIRIIKPLLSLASIKVRMATRKVIALSKLHLKTKSADVQEGDWITVGVLITKSEPKMSSKGKQYSIWTLSDLEDVDRQVKFFLFGDIHKQLWKTQYGSVIGILNANIMQSSDQKYQNKADEICITVDKHEKVLNMGMARDLGICKAKTKAGKDCRNAINVIQGDYCTYHVQAAYKKAGAKRSELQNGCSGITPRSFEKTLAKKGATEVMYGGHFYTTAPNTSLASKKKNQVNIKSVVKHQGSIQGKGKVTTMSLHKLLPEDEKKLQDLEAARLEEKNKQFHEMLTTPTVGSLNLVQHLIKKELNTTKPTQGEPKKVVQSVKASELIKMHKQQVYGPSQKLPKPASLSGLSQKIESGPSQMTPVPKGLPSIGKGLKPGGNVSLDFDFDSPPLRPIQIPKWNIEDLKKAKSAKDKAIEKVSKSGGIQKQDPNAIKKKIKSSGTLDKIKKRVADENEDSEGKDECASDRPLKKRSKLLGGLDLESEEVQKLLKRKSVHASELSEKEQEQLDAYFDVLEKKEKMEDKMASTMSKECNVVSCKNCSYTHFKALDTCKSQQHKLHYHKAVQRWFKCKNCNKRLFAFSKYPSKPCEQCGGSSFERASMLAEKKGPPLPQDQLLLRGEERKYVNS